MKSSYLTLLAVATLLTVCACGKEESQPAGQKAGNALLAYVPSATPYLAANLEPTPDEVIDSYLQKAAPILLAAQSELARVRDRLANAPDAAENASKLILALLQELDGKLNRPGLESLGFDLQSPKVVYGMGIFPVARIGLSDAGAFRSTVQRILDHAGVQAPELKFQGKAYWRLGADSPAGHHRAKVAGGLYIAILNEHLAMSIFPVSAENELLPLFLGIQKPENSDAVSRLAAVNSRYHFTPYFTALLDLQLVANEFLEPDSLLARTMAAAGASALTNLSDDCKGEFRTIISHTPRLVAGTTELTPNSIGLQYIVETQPELAKQLSNLVADVAVVEADSSRLLEFSFGLKLGPVRDFLREKVMAVSEAPYRCEQLQQLNAHAASMLARLDQPMPPLVNNLRGLRVSLSRFNMPNSMPEDIAGLLAVHVEQPEMFVGMAQMFLPDLASLNLVKGNPPVQIPASLIPMANVTAFAALSDNAIGMAFGAGEEQLLSPFLERKAAADGTFMSLNYDTAAYLDFTRRMGRKWRSDSGAAENEGNLSGSGEDHAVAAMEIAEAIQQAYKAVAGRSQMRLRFNDQGLVIDSRMTFK